MSHGIYLLYQATQVYPFSFCGMLKHIVHWLTVVTATEVGLMQIRIVMTACYKYN